MSVQPQYALLFVAVDGSVQLQAHKHNVKRSTGSTAVKTLALGYAGESPGAGMIDLEVTSAVPAGGFEFQAGVKMLGLIATKVYVQGPGGQTLQCQGQIIADTLSQSVDAAAEYSFTMRAPLVDWQNALGL